MDNVKITTDSIHWIVTIDGFRHLVIDIKSIIASHSYIDAEFLNPNPVPHTDGPFVTKYFIEFYLASGQMIKAEYNNRELWEKISKGL